MFAFALLQALHEIAFVLLAVGPYLDPIALLDIPLHLPSINRSIIKQFLLDLLQSLLLD